MTAPKASPQRAGRKPGPRIPCGGCFAMLTAREWKGHFAGCAGKGAAKLGKLLSGEYVVVQQSLEDSPPRYDRYAVYAHVGAKRIGPWRETPIEAVRDCPIDAAKPRRRSAGA